MALLGFRGRRVGGRRSFASIVACVGLAGLSGACATPTSNASGAASGAVAVDVTPVGGGDLTITPHESNASSCPDLFHGGETVDVSGGGYAPASSVALTIMPTTPEATTKVVTADAEGSIAVTVQLPTVLTGLRVGSSGYLQADGLTANGTTQSDNVLFGVGKTSTVCVAASTASATVSLFGLADPAAPASGAIFAIAGPGLPAVVGNPPKPGTFAELDTSSDESTVCATKEPRGVRCADGTLAGLTAGATYTVTEVRAPNGYLRAPSQTFQATNDEYAKIVGFVNQYAGSAPPASLTVALSAPDQSALPSGAVFAITGLGLPATTGPAPARGTFAELDTASYTPAEATAGAVTTCPPREPAGVTCADGVLEGLQPGATYLVTEIAAPHGYGLTAPQTITTWTDGSPTQATFVDPVAK
jgi:hypothetical protein